MLQGYGYDGRLESISEEYSFEGVYLDNAAAPLVAKSVAFKSAEFLAYNQLVNPHSRTFWSQKTVDLIEETRRRALEMLGAPIDEYDLVFTLNATASLKLIAECIESFHFLYLKDSHTSVVGVRALAKSYLVDTDISAVETLDNSWVVSWPLQSNFDGRRYPTDWISHVRSKEALSVLDISSYCCTSMPKLEEWPDMAVLSFYKIFGLPDLGGLLIRKSQQTRDFFHRRKYAGGGTVSSITPERQYMVRNEHICTSLEDGTVPFHSVAMLSCAMTEFNRIYGSFTNISAHTFALQQYCHHQLQQTGLCEIISPLLDCGPIVTFILKNSGYYEFANVCNKLDIHVRVGTLCNMGGFTEWSKISDQQLINNHKVHGKTCSDEMDVLDGKAMGVIRVSFGPYTTKANVDKLLGCVSTYFGDNNLMPRGNVLDNAEIHELIVYPIKSCAGFKVKSTRVSERGLEWDREFCLVNPTNNKVYSLKSNLVMANIHVEPMGDILKVSFQGSSISIQTDTNRWSQKIENNVHFCGPRTSDLILHHDPKVRAFFSKILGTNCTIAKITDYDARHSVSSSQNPDKPLSLSNSSPILLISTTSANALEGSDHHVFRANIVVKTKLPWDEDTWSQVKIGAGTFNLLGPCRRCNMVCVSRDGKSDARPYLELTKKRLFNGKLWFGQHMQTHRIKEGSVWTLEVGNIIECISTTAVEF